MKQIDGAFRRVRNDLNKLVKKTKGSYYKKCLIKIIRIQKQRAWNIINKLINKQSKTTTVNELIVNDKSITEPEPIANALNTYFSNILVLIWLTTNQRESYVLQTDKTFQICEVTLTEVWKQ